MSHDELVAPTISAEAPVFRTYGTGVQYLTTNHPQNQGETKTAFQELLLRLVGAYLITELPKLTETQLELVLRVTQRELAHSDLSPPQRGNEHYRRLWQQLQHGKNLTPDELRVIARVLLKTVQHQAVIARLKLLGEEVTVKCYDHAEEVTTLCVQGAITGTGSHAAARAATLVGDRSNLGQSAFLTLVEVGKGYVQQLHKLVDLERFFSAHPTAWAAFLLFGRSHYAKKSLAHKWHIREQGALAWMTGVRRTLERTKALPPAYTTTKPRHARPPSSSPLSHLGHYAPLTAAEFRLAATVKIHEVTQRLTQLSPQSRPYQNTQTFLRKLQRLAEPEMSAQVVDHLFHGSLQVPLRLGRQDLYQRCLTLRSVIKGRAKKYYSAVEAVLTCAALLFPQVVAVPVHSLSPATVLTPAHSLIRPFARRRAQYQAYQAQETRENPLLSHTQPLQLIMKHDQVIIRSGNNDRLTHDMRQHGYLDLWFPACRLTRLKGVLFRKQSSSRPRNTETISKRVLVRVIATPKMQHILQMGAQINQLVLLPPQGPKRKLKVNIIFSGAKAAFISWKYLTPTALERFCQAVNYTFPASDVIAFDLNRICDDILASSTQAPISFPLKRTCDNYRRITQERQKLQSSLSRAQLHEDSPKVQRIRRSLSLLENRKIHLRQATHELTSLEAGSILALSQATVALSEELTLDPRNTRGGLARAIYNMPDEVELLLRAVRAVRACYPTRNLQLYLLPPLGTSLRHVGCTTTPPGRLKRSPGNYDRGPCTTCGLIKNTHINAAEDLIVRFHADPSAYLPTQL